VVDTNFTPYQPTPLVPDARRPRIVVVSEARFLREGLAEILERNPSRSRGRARSAPDRGLGDGGGHHRLGAGGGDRLHPDPPPPSPISCAW